MKQQRAPKTHWRELFPSFKSPFKSKVQPKISKKELCVCFHMLKIKNNEPNINAYIQTNTINGHKLKKKERESATKQIPKTTI